MTKLLATMVGMGILAASIGSAQGELIIHYPLNETSGTTIDDVSSTDLDLAATATTPSPTFGGASPAPDSTASRAGWDDNYRLDGLTGEIGDLQSFTAMAWVLDEPFEDGATSGDFVIFFSHSGGPVRLGFALGGSQMQAYVGQPSSTRQWRSASYGSLDLSGWHHYAWVFDGNQADDADKLTWYIDGVELDDAATIIGSNTSTAGPPTRVVLGHNVQGSGELDQVLGNFLDDFWYFGSTDDSSGALSQSEIRDTAGIIPEPGDYNGDGFVNAADYTIWRDTLGAQGQNLAADGDGSEVVDAGDYQVWKQNFSAVNASASFATAPVPEPAAIALSCVAIAVLGAMVVRRRRRSGRHVSGGDCGEARFRSA